MLSLDATADQPRPQPLASVGAVLELHLHGRLLMPDDAAVTTRNHDKSQCAWRQQAKNSPHPAGSCHAYRPDTG